MFPAGLPACPTCGSVMVPDGCANDCGGERYARSQAPACERCKGWRWIRGSHGRSYPCPDCGTGRGPASTGGTDV